jgi:AcrR family transcriptional regulator
MTTQKIINKRKIQKDLILKSAIDIINVEGIDGLTMRNLAKKIDYSLPIIYRHFRNKEDIIGTLAQGGYASLNSMIQETLDKHNDDTYEVRMKEVTSAFVNFAQSQPALYQIMFERFVNQQKRYSKLFLDLKIILKSFWRNRVKVDTQVDLFIASINGVVAMINNLKETAKISEEEINDMVGIFSRKFSSS